MFNKLSCVILFSIGSIFISTERNIMNKRIIIFTGKGGVGKSSIASAHALKSSKEGVKTILLSTDNAHNLSDIFEIEANDENDIINVRENLDLLEINSQLELRENFPKIKSSVSKYTNTSKYSLDDSFTIPGFENLVNLLKIKDIYENYDYERIIVDCPPTAATISLLKLPELLSRYLERFFPVGKTIVRVLAPMSKFWYNIDLPSREKMDDIEKMYYELLKLQMLLKDKEITSVRLVCLAEKMVVEETKRNYMYLNLYDYNVDKIFINRVFTGHDDNKFISKLKDIQKKYIEEIEETFAHIDICPIKWYEKEIQGLDKLDFLCQDSLDYDDLFDIKISDHKQEFAKYENGYLLKLTSLKGYEDDYKIEKIGNDLDIKINNFKRSIPLPNILYNSRIEKIDKNEDRIDIYFKVEEVEE